MNRKPAVAGRFYPGNRSELKKSLRDYISEEKKKIDTDALIVPHAGYIYSGSTAGKVYGSCNLSDSFIIVCPNHTGRGEAISIISEGTWETPLGKVAIDEEGAEALMSKSDLIREDREAHREEHSLEVQLPFLQHLVDEFQFIPICFKTKDRSILSEVGKSIGEHITASNTQIIVSTDMTHFESEESAEEKDMKAVEEIKELDPEGLADTVVKNNISMCGWAPTYSALKALKKAGTATKAQLVDYSTSADASGDRSRVVGYAGMVLY